MARDDICLHVTWPLGYYTYRVGTVSHTYRHGWGILHMLCAWAKSQQQDIHHLQNIHHLHLQFVKMIKFIQRDLRRKELCTHNFGPCRHLK